MKLGSLQCKSNFNRNEVLLLMIENIKTNQIGKFCQGDIKCTKKLPELLFLYPFTSCVPCVPQSSRNILSIINTDTLQMGDSMSKVREKGQRRKVDFFDEM